jgi:hypothetical protein
MAMFRHKTGEGDLPEKRRNCSVAKIVAGMPAGDKSLPTDTKLVS